MKKSLFTHSFARVAFLLSFVGLGVSGHECKAALFQLDFSSLEGGAASGGWDLIDNVVAEDTCNYLGVADTACTIYPLTDLSGLDNDVTLEILEIPMLPNNPAHLGELQVYDGLDVPVEAIGDYQYRNPDTAGASAPFRFSNIDPGSYRVTVFEGRTTDGNGQFAKLWVGDADGSNEPGEPGEHEGKNTEDFAMGSSTLSLEIGEGDFLWYRHLEDNSGGISGIIIRPDSDDLIPRAVNGSEFGTLALTGSLANKVLSEVGPQSGLAQYWFDGNITNPDDYQAIGTEGDDINPLVNPEGNPIATAGTWWSGSQSLVANGNTVNSYPPELIDSRFEGGNQENYAVKLKGEIFVPEDGEFLIRDGIDDFAMIAIDQDGNGELDSLADVVDVDLGIGGHIDDVLVLDNAAVGVNAANLDTAAAQFENVDAGGEWRTIEIWMSEAGGGDAGAVYMAKSDDPDVWDDAVALSQEQIDKFLISDEQVRTEAAATLVSADVLAAPPSKSALEYIVQVGPGGNDQIAVAEGGGDFTTQLDLSDTTVRVQVDGELSDGAEFTIFGADEVLGLDSLNLVFDDASQWDLSGLGEGKIVFGTPTPPSGCDATTGGDLDGNGTVEFADFLILSANFGNAATDHTTGDIDCNGTVEFADFLVLSANFGSAVATQSVPEPSSHLLVTLAGIVMLACLRRQK